MLKEQLKNLPNNPGIYQFFDKNEKLLYVGKAKNLKNRVKTYINLDLSPAANLSPRINAMVMQISRLNFIITPSEADALILENSFIKQLKPKYNILLKDDKTYPYIFTNLNDDFPRFEITRKIINDKNIQYFGPFFSGAKSLLEAIYSLHKLVQKASCLKGKKACLYYQMKLCYAPCENKISKEEYNEIYKKAKKDLLKPRNLLPRLKKLMIKHAENENYEQAAKIRDCMKDIENTSIKSKVDIAKNKNFFAYAANYNENLACITCCQVSNGKISGIKSNLSSVKISDKSELSKIYEQAILQDFSLPKPINSREIYCLDDFENSKLLANILENQRGLKFKIKSPKMGGEFEICKIALENANLQLKNKNNPITQKLKDYFNLDNSPNTIEIFDNSHLFASNQVGAMVCYEFGEFNKQKYRKKHLTSNNDYDQMKENLLSRAMKFNELSPPDLWLIDGGKALLDLAQNIVESSGANIDVLAISKEKIDGKTQRTKGKAKDKICSKLGIFSLPENDEKLIFLQKLRDEAHNYAINFHKKTRLKNEMNASKLKKAGISQANIVKLVNFYGSFDKIINSNFNEIKELTNANVAKKISEIYKGNDSDNL